jgi:Transposase
MADVMIGTGPHKSSHTAVAIGAGEEPLGELQVRACPSQAEQLVAWAAGWPERAWAIEGAAGLGCLLAQQLVAAGERVLDVPPKLAARVRLLPSGDTGKNDPNDAFSAAVAALRSPAPRPVLVEDYAVVLKVWSLCRYRHKDHYPDTAVMPIPVAGVLVGGGGRARDIGIIRGLPGRPAAGPRGDSGRAGLPAGWSGRGLAA